MTICYSFLELVNLVLVDLLISDIGLRILAKQRFSILSFLFSMRTENVRIVLTSNRLRPADFLISMRIRSSGLDMIESH